MHCYNSVHNIQDTADACELGISLQGGVGARKCENMKRVKIRSKNAQASAERVLICMLVEVEISRVVFAFCSITQNG